MATNTKGKEAQRSHAMSYDGRIHTVQIGAATRDLPIFKVAPGVNIAIFNMLGDTEIVETAADELAKLMPPATDALVVPEVKAIPLGHALSVRTGLPLVVVRKFRKPYMGACLETTVHSITTGKPQTLYVDGRDMPLIQGKKVTIVDDVISTGSTLNGLLEMMRVANADVVGEMAVFTEGPADAWLDVIRLGHLPLFEDAE
jgi:adenine phosphoribosyltransferase